MTVFIILAAIPYLWVAILFHAYLFFNRPGYGGNWCLAVLQGAIWPYYAIKFCCDCQPVEHVREPQPGTRDESEGAK